MHGFGSGMLLMGFGYDPIEPCNYSNVGKRSQKMTCKIIKMLKKIEPIKRRLFNQYLLSFIIKGFIN